MVRDTALLGRPSALFPDMGIPRVLIKATMPLRLCSSEDGDMAAATMGVTEEAMGVTEATMGVTEVAMAATEVVMEASATAAVRAAATNIEVPRGPLFSVAIQ